MGTQLTGGGSPTKWGAGTPSCPRCGKSVYFAEQVSCSLLLLIISTQISVLGGESCGENISQRVFTLYRVQYTFGFQPIERS